MNVQYLHGADGQPTGVFIPIQEWEQLQAALQKPVATTKIGKKQRFKEEFRESVQELKLIQAGKKQAKLAQDFLAELRALPSKDA